MTSVGIQKTRTIKTSCPKTLDLKDDRVKARDLARKRMLDEKKKLMKLSCRQNEDLLFVPDPV